MMACDRGRGHAPCLDALLKHCPKEQVLATDKDGWTALMLASYNGHAPCIDALLKHCPKEQVLATDKDGWTALMLACFNGDAPCIDALLKQRPKEQSLDGALEKLAIRYEAAPTDALQACCERLLALGAVIVDRKTGEALRPITTDVAQRARIPHLINEAVVTALTHSRGARSDSSS
jgi:ankyrin repeat protein